MAVSAGAGMAVVVVVETCHMSAARSDGSDVGVVSVSHSSNEAHRSVITFHMPLGKGPDQDLAQYCSIQRSFVSTFSTVFMSSSVGAGSMVVGGSATG